MSLGFSDLTSLAADLGRAPVAVQAASMLAVEETGRGILTDAEASSPVLTGLLSSSFRLEVSGLSATVSNDALYADEVEYGTSDTPAQPSLGPAFERHERTLDVAAADAGVRLLR